jgi:L-cystine uptake protein TcyP (sodium:dicarboxylate symporter family)
MGGDRHHIEENAGKVLSDMTRMMLVYALLFLTPFAIFSLWRYLVHGARTRGEIWSDAPVIILILSGMALVFAVLFYYVASYEQYGVDRKYVPAHEENGVTIPGHFE